MPKTINSVILGGHISEPQVKHFDGGGSITTFTLVTKITWKKEDGGFDEKPSFHRVTVKNDWQQKKLDGIGKGHYVVIQGYGQSRDWEKDGVKQYGYDIVARDVIPMAPPKGDTGHDKPAPQDDDLPF